MNLKKLILDNMEKKDDLSNARYVYLKIPEYVSFSTTFPNTNEDKMNKLHKEKVDIENVGPLITCNSWASIFSQLLNELNIKNEIINEWHQYVKFEADGKIWVADATYGKYTDLARIKYGDTTTRFGVSLKQNYEPSIYVDFSDPDNKKLEDIDSNIPFYVERKKMLEETRKTLGKVKGLDIPLKEKVDYIFNFIGTLKPGYYEASDYVYELEEDFLSSEEFSHVKGTELKRNTEPVDILKCITVEDNGYYYYLLGSGMPLREVTQKDLLKLSMFGGFGLDGKEIPGVDIPRKFNIYKHDFSMPFMLSDEIKPYVAKTL